jgi:hypothetical protein
MAQQSDSDQSKAIQLFLDSTQCQFEPKLWMEESIRKWFGKRNRFAFGANHSAPEEYFSVQNLRKICMQLRKHQPPKVGRAPLPHSASRSFTYEQCSGMLYIIIIIIRLYNQKLNITAN